MPDIAIKVNKKDTKNNSELNAGNLENFEEIIGLIKTKSQDAHKLVDILFSEEVAARNLTITSKIIKNVFSLLEQVIIADDVDAFIKKTEEIDKDFLMMRHYLF